MAAQLIGRRRQNLAAAFCQRRLAAFMPFVVVEILVDIGLFAPPYSKSSISTGRGLRLNRFASASACSFKNGPVGS